MDNQHRLIAGYRDLSPWEVEQMNLVKAVGNSVGEMIATLEQLPLDQRWVAIAKTQLQQGIMAAVRAIAQPTSF